MDGRSGGLVSFGGWSCRRIALWTQDHLEGAPNRCQLSWSLKLRYFARLGRAHASNANGSHIRFASRKPMICE
jgi:hypothetical protein